MHKQRNLWVALAMLLVLLPTGLAGQTLAVSEAARLASERHPTVAAARAGVARAQSGVDEASAERLPVLATEAAFTRFKEPMVVAPLHGLDPVNPPQFDRMLAQGNVSLNYTLYDGGARAARIDRAEAQVDAAQSATVSVRRTMLAEGVRAYLRVRTTRELHSAQQRRVVALTGERDRARRIFDAGRAPRLMLTRAEAALSAAEADATTSRLDVDLAERDLARLTGLDLERVRGDSLQPLPTAPIVTPATREALLERAREANPDLLRLRQQVSAAEHGRGEARALWLPRLNVGGRFVQYAASASDPASEWQGGVHVSYPLFTGGARSAAADRASAEVAVARAELAAGELRVSEAIDRALSASEAAHARVAALRAAVEQAAEVTRIERLALDAGTGVQSDYILAEAELLRVRAALTEATYAEVLARVELARVTGEISPEWIKQNLEPGS